MPEADRMCRTETEVVCLAELRAQTGQVDGPMERHSVRVVLLTRQLARARALEIDDELVTCAGLLHDLGLYPGAASRQAYVSDSRRLAERLLTAQGWHADRTRRCAEAVEQHHAPRPQWRRGTECELLRRADLIEVSHGLLRFGLDRSQLDAIVAAVPRDGFATEVVRGVARSARERPATLLRIFTP